MDPTGLEFSLALSEAAKIMDLNPLKPKQVESIQSFAYGKDTFVALPTGYGKSVIFAILLLLFDLMRAISGSIVVIITPLISLMLDQKEKFVQKGLKIDFVGQAQHNEQALEAVINGQIQLVYISPESLLENKRYRNMLSSKVYQEKMVAIVVDEAHYVKFWGNEFRTLFAKLGNVRSLLPDNINILALTATATRNTLECVTSRLAMDKPTVTGLYPDRPNIILSVQPCPSITTLCKQLADELKEKCSSTPKTIVFCRSLKHCADMCVLMRRHLGPHTTDPPGLPSDLQHRLIDVFTAASDSDVREEVLKEFCKVASTLRLLIATTAFGLGVDCKYIKRVINYGTPGTLEELVQELGRAGRDGSEAEAVLYHKNIGKKITHAMKVYGENTSECRRKLLFQDFLFYEQSRSMNFTAASVVTFAHDYVIV